MPDTNVDRAIGRLKGRLDEVVKKIDALAERQDETSAEARRRRYERVGAVETSIEINGQIDVQVHDRIDDLDAKISADVMPTINEVKRWKITSMAVLSMVGIASAALGATAIWLWEVIVERVKGRFIRKPQ